jgi:molybdenum cofactor cytidylyltransferase
MGRPKATLPLGDHSFLARIVRSFQEAGVDDVVVVLGAEANVISERLREEAVTARVVVNERYESGQLSSLLAGLRAVDRPGVRAVLLTLVDVPLVAPSTIRAVLDRYRDTGAMVVRPIRGKEHGHPVLIDRRLFDALRGADPASGAKPVVRAHASPEGEVPIDDDGAYLDIDTPEEYAHAMSRFRDGGA